MSKLLVSFFLVFMGVATIHENLLVGSLSFGIGAAYIGRRFFRHFAKRKWTMFFLSFLLACFALEIGMIVAVITAFHAYLEHYRDKERRGLMPVTPIDPADAKKANSYGAFDNPAYASMDSSLHTLWFVSQAEK